MMKNTTVLILGITILLCLLHTPAVDAHPLSTQQLQACGKHLADLLALVCKGIFNKPEDTTPAAVRRRRGVVDECCRQRCSFEQLQQYCG